MSYFLEVTAEAMTEAFSFMQTDSVTYKGVTVFGAAREESLDTLNFGGYESHFKGSVYVLKAGFPEPSRGDRIELNGTERRITGWTETPIYWALELEDVTR